MKVGDICICRDNVGIDPDWRLKKVEIMSVGGSYCMVKLIDDFGPNSRWGMDIHYTFSNECIKPLKLSPVLAKDML